MEDQFRLDKGQTGLTRLKTESTSSRQTEIPSVPKKEAMSYRILIATNESPLSSKAAKAAIELAQNHPGSKIIGLSLPEPLFLSRTGMAAGIDMLDYELFEHDQAQLRAEHIAGMARAAGVPCETFVDQSSCAQEGILKTAARHDCNCIFLAAQGTGDKNQAFADNMFGKVLADANIPVMIYR